MSEKKPATASYLSEGIFESPFRSCPNASLCRVEVLFQKVVVQYMAGLDSCQKSRINNLFPHFVLKESVGC